MWQLCTYVTYICIIPFTLPLIYCTQIYKLTLDYI